MEEGGRRQCVKHFPPMPTKQKLTAVVCTEKVPGCDRGERERKTLHWWMTVEAIDTDTLHWSTVSSLPHPLCDASVTVCKDRVYHVASRATLPASSHKVDKVSFHQLSEFPSPVTDFAPCWKPHSMALVTYQQKVPPVSH